MEKEPTFPSRPETSSLQQCGFHSIPFTLRGAHRLEKKEAYPSRQSLPQLQGRNMVRKKSDLDGQKPGGPVPEVIPLKRLGGGLVRTGLCLYSLMAGDNLKQEPKSLCQEKGN